MSIKPVLKQAISRHRSKCLFCGFKSYRDNMFLVYRAKPSQLQHTGRYCCDKCLDVHAEKIKRLIGFI